MNCEILGLKESFQGTCFGHAFSKARQYVTTYENVCEGFKYVSIKFLKKTYKNAALGQKKSGKDILEWCNNVYVDYGFYPKKLNTLMKTRLY